MFVGVGSNRGDRLAHLRRAAQRLAETPEVEVICESSVYETEAHTLPGQGAQPDHLNAVLHLRTALAPHDLLHHLQAIEREAGRNPEAPRWSARPLDLDVLLWEDREIETADLAVPHPRLAERRFVLAPLADLAPDHPVPGTGRGGSSLSVADLLVQCDDVARLRRIDATLPFSTTTPPCR